MFCPRIRGRARGAHPVLAVLLILAGASGALAQAPELALHGQVVDGRTSAPIAAVHVHIDGQSALTDAEGRFTLIGVPESAVLRFERIGYRPLRQPASRLDGPVSLQPDPVLLDALVINSPYANALAAGTALSVAGVGRAEMEAGAHTSVAEALGGVEGVSVARMGSWGSRVFLRGLGDERITVLIDGMRVNAACAFGMDQGVATLDPATVERVEVLTGPGSALFGSGNIGGVVNVITRKPAPSDRLRGEVRTSAATGTPGGAIGATLGLGRGDFDATIAVDGSRYDDYRTPAGTVDGSSFRHGTADLTLGWTPGPASRVTFRTQAYEGRDIGWPAMNGASIPAESRRNFALDYGVQLGRGVLDGVAARAYLQRLDHDMRVEMTMDGAMPMSSLTEQRSHATTSGARLQLRLMPLAGSHLDVGAEVTNLAAENSRWTQQSGPMGSSTIEFRTWPGVDILDAGLFGQGELELGRRLTATLGARADHVTRQADGHATSREWIGSGNAGLRLALPHGFGARASLGYGYRIPNPTELFGLALKADGFVYQGNAELATETNRNVELSLGYDRPRLSASATAFRTDLQGMITPVLAQGDTISGKPVRTYANLAEARLVGGSGSIRWQPRDVFSLGGTMSYTRGEDPASGATLPAVPPLQASLTAHLEDATGRWIAVEGLAAARQRRVASAVGEIETAGYAVANLSAGLRIAGTHATVGVDNVLDHAYRAHLDPVRLLRPGRSAYIKLSKRFGGEDAHAPAR